MALLVVSGALLPLLVRYGRGLTVTGDDVLYALVFVKYFLLYALFRLSITNAAEVRTCLALILTAGAFVALVALLQVNNAFGVAELLHRYYDAPFEGMTGPSATRATSTIASAFGLADLTAMSLAVALAMLAMTDTRRLVLIALAILLLAGAVSAGSFSGVIGLAVVIGAVAIVSWRRLRAEFALIVPATLVVMAALWPVVATRLAGFDRYQGLPRSWIGRLENLEHFFWPELFSGLNWLLGVRPAARVAAPEAWREWVYIESGHTW
jgi:hypothetical protein